MSDTDIYKSREQSPNTSTASRSGKRRRSSSRHPFDEKDRRRRSKNSGLRRFLHLYRKGENEKHFWRGLLVATVVIMALIAIWQFWYLERVAREQSRQGDMYIPIQEQSQDASPAE
ncbi:MAG: hypothetical protein DRP64_01635 [Verrucomicrobia bacterium]|nr:MAG: hypothetical protein DRP64_01635 [Verrucomicrobiota bacterium]